MLTVSLWGSVSMAPKASADTAGYGAGTVRAVVHHVQRFVVLGLYEGLRIGHGISEALTRDGRAYRSKQRDHQRTRNCQEQNDLDDCKSGLSGLLRRARSHYITHSMLIIA